MQFTLNELMCGHWTTVVVIDLLCTYWTAVWLLNKKEMTLFSNTVKPV